MTLTIAIGVLAAGYWLIPLAWLIDRRHARNTALRLAEARLRAADAAVPPLPDWLAPRPQVAQRARSGQPSKASASEQPRGEHGHWASPKPSNGSESRNT